MINFNKKWNEIPTVWIDTETTGINPSIDKAVQISVCRFENCLPVETITKYVNPGIIIPDDVIEIHHITNEIVKNCNNINDIFFSDDIQKLFKDAQIGAYNGIFDKHFIPIFENIDWPWLDTLVFIRDIDKYVGGSGRHKLKASCVRHDVQLNKAHDAEADAEAAGKLFYIVVPKYISLKTKYVCPSLGLLLKLQKDMENLQWFEYYKWKTSLQEVK